jgi:hypothetical protein
MPPEGLPCPRRLDSYLAAEATTLVACSSQVGGFLRPTTDQVALMRELVAAFNLSRARVVTAEDDSGFVVSVEHEEYARPVAKLEYMETRAVGPSPHQAARSLHRVVVDRRFAQQAEKLLKRDGYVFEGMAYADYAHFKKADSRDVQHGQEDSPGCAAPVGHN